MLPIRHVRILKHPMWMWENGVDPDRAVAGRTGLADAAAGLTPDSLTHAIQQNKGGRPPTTTAFRLPDQQSGATWLDYYR